MGLKYLLDTNIISEPIKQNPNPFIISQLATLSGETVLSAISWHELLYGLNRLPESKRKRKISSYLFSQVRPNLPIVDYDQACAEWHAEQRARLSGLGKTPSFIDGQIAAIAGQNSLILVTRNVSDFQDFENLEIENWFNQ